MTTVEVVSIIVQIIILPSLVALAGYVKANAKNKKVAKAAHNLNLIGSEALKYIKEAEKFTGYAGKEKKAWVITRVNQWAIDNKVPFTYEDVSEKIEQLVELTKDVNKRKKDEEEEEPLK